MSSQVVRLCLVAILIIYCAANPTGNAKSSEEEGKDVYQDVKQLLQDARDLVSPPTTKEAHKHRHPHRKALSQPEDLDMMGDAEVEATKPQVRKPRQRRFEMLPQWPADPEFDPYVQQQQQQHPQYGQEYYGHPYNNYPYPGYDNWYSRYVPNYHAYNVPPEREWRTTVHDAPEPEWTVHIEFPDMEPLILTNKNYSKASNVKVVMNKVDVPNRKKVRDRHIPIPGHVPVHPNFVGSTQVSYSPSSNSQGRNKKERNRPITWNVDLTHPVNIRRPVPLHRPPRPLQYIPPQPYYPYNAAPTPLSWSPITRNWIAAPYYTLGHPSMDYNWPNVQVSYPSHAYLPEPTRRPIQPGRPAPMYPSFGVKTNGDDDEDFDEESKDEDEENNGNVENKEEDDEEDKEYDEDEDEEKEQEEEEDEEEEEEEPFSAENGNGDDEDNSEDNDIETSTPKKALFSWG